jgi:hypothetical protein
VARDRGLVDDLLLDLHDMILNLSGPLFLIFLVLKLCRVIDWSWLWVTSPLWIALASVFLVTIIQEVKKQLRK